MDWQWNKFLGRPEAGVDAFAARAAVQGRRVLITGAGGSLGRCLAEAALLGDPLSLVLCDNSEYALYEVHRKLTHESLVATDPVPIVPILGDIGEPGFVRMILRQHRPDLILHAAAYKHVPLLESNPFAAMRNNALGTWHLVEALRERGECDFILLSTDKAVEPHSIMGASKRIAELATLAHGNDDCRMSVLRLSNVLESSGSVVPLFAEQLQQGLALTVTHPQVRRFLITGSEAADALLHAASARLGNKVLIPGSSDPIAIIDLADYMNDRYAAEHRRQSADPTQTPIQIIGLRPGEKLVEKLTSAHETLEQTLPCGLRVFRSPCPHRDELSRRMAVLQRAVHRFDEAAMNAAFDALLPDFAGRSQVEQASSIDSGLTLASS